MLKNFSQNLAKAYSCPFSLVSLTDTSMFFRSKVKKSRSDKIKFFLSNPNKYKRIARMKVPDLKDPNITFPITIPIKYRFVYRPIKNPPKLPTHDYINFKTMTGNEILLNLSNVEQLRPTELASALTELGKRPGSADVDWNAHEYLTKCVEISIKNLPSYDARTVSTLLYAYHRLRINEPLLWSTLARESSKTVHKIKAKGFGATFVCFNAEPDRCTREYKERLASLLPIHLKNMNPTLLTKCFELTLKENLMTQYLFEDHFFMFIWKRNHWFGAANYPAWIKGLVQYDFKEDLEFWNIEFMSSIDKVVESATAEEAQKIINALQEAKAIVPNLIIDRAVDTLNKRIAFVNTTLKQVENNKFWNIVRNDIEYYRQKEKLKMEKERAQAHA